MAEHCDALIIVSFGGPERPQDVMPFLENVLRGKNVPRARMLEVAEHYYHFGGVSPINAQNRALIAALKRELADHDLRLPVYWGNRNWHPLLPATLRQMRAEGVRRALAFFTSAYSSYSGCRQYREDIERAQAAVGAGVPEIHKLRVFFNHPGFIEPSVERVCEALRQFPDSRREAVQLLFTAHSIPLEMASGCHYEEQLLEAARLISGEVGPQPWRLVYQSRSGPPHQPWLEPDVGDCLRQLHEQGLRDVVIAPIGFISDHMEVLYDLDTEARQLCDELGMRMVRAGTVGTHPRFVRMIRELVEERLSDDQPRLALGCLPASHDICPVDCCKFIPGRRPGG